MKKCLNWNCSPPPNQKLDWTIQDNPSLNFGSKPNQTSKQKFSLTSEGDLFFSDREDHSMVYGKVLDKYDLKKEVIDYLPKTYVGTNAQEEVDVLTDANDLNNNELTEVSLIM